MTARAKRTSRRGHADYAQLDALRRRDVKAIANLRFGAQLPDSEEGRQFLGVLIALRLPAEEIHKIAPWCAADPATITEQAAAVRRSLTAAPIADRIGEVLEFEFEELKTLAEQGYSVSQVASYDAQRWQEREYWDERRRKSEADRKRRNRAQEAQQMDNHLPQRTKVVKSTLTGDWQPQTAIAERVAKPFRLRGPSLLRAVARHVENLVKRRCAETKTEDGKHGMKTCFVRLLT